MDVVFFFDLLLAALLMWLGWEALTARSLLRAIVMFIAFGLSMGLAWTRLDAPEVALAEIAVGAGLTGALLLVGAKASDHSEDDDD